MPRNNKLVCPTCQYQLNVGQKCCPACETRIRPLKSIFRKFFEAKRKKAVPEGNAVFIFSYPCCPDCHAKLTAEQDACPRCGLHRKEFIQKFADQLSYLQSKLNTLLCQIQMLYDDFVVLLRAERYGMPSEEILPRYAQLLETKNKLQRDLEAPKVACIGMNLSALSHTIAARKLAQQTTDFRQSLRTALRKMDKLNRLQESLAPKIALRESLHYGPQVCLYGPPPAFDRFELNRKAEFEEFLRNFNETPTADDPSSDP